MDFIQFVVAYMAFTLFFIVVLLFGENVALQGTPIAWAHWLITTGSVSFLECVHGCMGACSFLKWVHACMAARSTASCSRVFFGAAGRLPSVACRHSSAGKAGQSVCVCVCVCLLHQGSTVG